MVGESVGRLYLPFWIAEFQREQPVVHPEDVEMDAETLVERAPARSFADVASGFRNRNAR